MNSRLPTDSAPSALPAAAAAAAPSQGAGALHRLLGAWALALAIWVVVAGAVVGWLWRSLLPTALGTWPWGPTLAAGVLAAAIVIACSAWRARSLLQGDGSGLIQWAGGEPLGGAFAVAQPAAAIDELESRFIALAGEASRAAGLPRSKLFVLQSETAINALAAGWTPSTTALAVTRGALETLGPDELRALLDHEMAHVRRGDARLQMAAASLIWGFVGPQVTGEHMRRPDRDGAPAGPVASLAGTVLSMAGQPLAWLGEWLQQQAAGQRELDADAAAAGDDPRVRTALAAVLQKAWYQQTRGTDRLQGARLAALAAALLWAPPGLLRRHPAWPERLRALTGQEREPLPCELLTPLAVDPGLSVRALLPYQAAPSADDGAVPDLSRALGLGSIIPGAPPLAGVRPADATAGAATNAGPILREPEPVAAAAPASGPIPFAAPASAPAAASADAAAGGSLLDRIGAVAATLRSAEPAGVGLGFERPSEPPVLAVGASAASVAPGGAASSPSVPRAAAVPPAPASSPIAAAWAAARAAGGAAQALAGHSPAASASAATSASTRSAWGSAGASGIGPSAAPSPAGAAAGSAAGVGAALGGGTALPAAARWSALPPVPPAGTPEAREIERLVGLALTGVLPASAPAAEREPAAPAGADTPAAAPGRAATSGAGSAAVPGEAPLAGRRRHRWRRPRSGPDSQAGTLGPAADEPASAGPVGKAGIGAGAASATTAAAQVQAQVLPQSQAEAEVDLPLPDLQAAPTPAPFAERRADAAVPSALPQPGGLELPGLDLQRLDAPVPAEPTEPVAVAVVDLDLGMAAPVQHTSTWPVLTPMPDRSGRDDVSVPGLTVTEWQVDLPLEPPSDERGAGAAPDSLAGVAADRPPRGPALPDDWPTLLPPERIEAAAMPDARPAERVASPAAEPPGRRGVPPAVPVAADIIEPTEPAGSAEGPSTDSAEQTPAALPLAGLSPPAPVVGGAAPGGSLALREISAWLDANRTQQRPQPAGDDPAAVTGDPLPEPFPQTQILLPPSAVLPDGEASAVRPARTAPRAAADPADLYIRRPKPPDAPSITATQVDEAARRLARLHGPGELRAAILAFMLSPHSDREYRAWRAETEALPRAQQVLDDLTLQPAAARLPWFDEFVRRAAAGAIDDRRAIVEAARRVMTAAGVVKPLERLRWLALRHGLGHTQKRAVVGPPAAGRGAEPALFAGNLRPIATYTAFLARLVPLYASDVGIDPVGERWYEAVMHNFFATADVPPARVPDSDALVHALWALQSMPWMGRPPLIRAWVSEAVGVAGPGGLRREAADALYLSCSMLDSPMPPELGRLFSELAL